MTLLDNLKCKIALTQEEKEQIADIDRAIKTLWDSYSTIIKILDYKTNETQIERLRAEISTRLEERNQIISISLYNFINKYTDLEGILKDLRQTLKGLKKEDFIAFIKDLENDIDADRLTLKNYTDIQNIENLEEAIESKTTLKDALKEDNEGAKAFLSLYTEIYADALRTLCVKGAAEEYKTTLHEASVKYADDIDKTLNIFLQLRAVECIRKAEKWYKSNKSKDSNETLIPVESKTYTPYIPPKSFSVLNSRPNQEITMLSRLMSEENNGQLSFNFEDMATPLTIREKNTKRKLEQIVTYTALNYESDELEFSKARILKHDTDILDAVCTCIQAGNNVITIEQIYQTMHGNAKTRPAKSQKERILLGLKKLRGTILYMDITQEIERGVYDLKELKAKKKDDRFIIDCPLLTWAGISKVNKNETTSEAIYISSIPPIMSYCKLKNEIVTFDIALLDTPGKANEKYNTIKIYLLKDITSYIKGARDNNKWLYSTIYNRCGIDEPINRNQKKRDIDAIKSNMLDYWKEQGLIKGYKDYKKDNAIVGFEIIND